MIMKRSCTILMFFSIYMMLLSKGLSLSCYKCTSTDKESCRRWQKPEKCKNMILHPFCLTMKYTKRRMVNGRMVDEHTYAMRCTRSDFGCGHHCSIEFMMGAISCQGNCCRGNFCNKLPTPHLSPPKNKRSNLHSEGGHVTDYKHGVSHAAPLKGRAATIVVYALTIWALLSSVNVR